LFLVLFELSDLRGVQLY